MRSIPGLPKAARTILVLPVAPMLAACGMPHDPAGTEDHIRKRGSVILGEVEGAAPDPASQRQLARAASSLGATVTRIPGHGEELLEGLEEGHFDLVYGEFADDSPWATSVHFGQPATRDGKPGKSERLPRFAFRNGENGWIMRVEDAGRKEREP
ncbi:hypothetical protein [Croceicoccus sp. BE223]|uniref:hypothetical protein n=1 Tax=Croceicoccus sp. BE223 TaxID=2817716 RepID=UPI002854E461|nr:hypothetical protein [Croceicoccus sp. BE223]MDR7102699.1 hypothetical protein [Croceicoccus sp. BE223]